MRMNQLFIFGVLQILSFGAMLLIYSQIVYQSTQIIQTNALIERQQSTLETLRRLTEKLDSQSQQSSDQLRFMQSEISQNLYNLLLAQSGNDDKEETFGFCKKYIAEKEDTEPQFSILDYSKPVSHPVNSTCYLMDKIKSELFTLCMYPPEDDLISRFINQDGMWEGGKTFLLSIFFREQLLKSNPRKVMLDLGANQGYYGFNAASFGYKVYMVEPGPSNVDLLRQTVIKNNFQDRVTIMQNAIGNVRQPVKFHFSPGNSGASTVSAGAGGGGQVFHSILPDDIPKKFGFPTTDIFLVKTDVEGFDFHAYDAMKRIIVEGRPPVLIMEVPTTNECAIEDTIRKLYELGYQFIFDDAPNKPWTLDQVINYPSKELREAIFIHSSVFQSMASQISDPRWYTPKTA